jgi:methyl-accepting chemotaxis protein
MFEKDTAMRIFMTFLDRKVKEAEEEITQKGVLSDDKAIPLMLKTQFNHIAHLEESVDSEFGNIRQQFKEIDQRFEQVDQRFEQVNQRFEQVNQRFEQVNQRFEQVNQRFDRMEEKFERRFEHLEERLDYFGRNVLAGFSALAGLMTLFHFVR